MTTPKTPHRHVVLLVEDNADNRDAMEMLIQAEGYDVITAHHGRAALSALRSGLRPCLVLLDLMMPGMNGMAFRKEQLADAALSAIPVVVTSVGGLPYEAEAQRLGMTLYLRKPVPVDQLAQVLTDHCGSN